MADAPTTPYSPDNGSTPRSPRVVPIPQQPPAPQSPQVKTEKRRRPSAKDWLIHRPRITSLYMHRGYSLQHVSDVMERDHGLVATPKMYKSRFRAWGLRKNAGTAKEWDGVKQHYKQHHHYLDRHTPAQRLLAGDMGDPTARIVFFQGDLDGPKAYQAALCAMYEYAWIPGAKAPGILPRPDEIYSHATVDWPAQMATATHLIREGGSRRSGLGFRLLNECFQSFASSPVYSSSSSSSSSPPPSSGSGLLQKTQQQQVDTATLFNIGFGAFALSTVPGHQLLDMYLTFITQILTIKWGARDPLSRFAEALRVLYAKQTDQPMYSFGMAWRSMEIVERRMEGTGFGPEHRLAFLRLHSWPAALVYADKRGFWDELEGIGGGSVEGQGRSQQRDIQGGGEQGAANDGVDINWHDGHRIPSPKERRRKKRQRIEAEPEKGEGVGTRLFLKARQMDPAWEHRVALWGDFIGENDLELVRSTGRQRVRQVGGVRFVTCIEDDDEDDDT